jgi:hypothetical protein
MLSSDVSKDYLNFIAVLGVIGLIASSIVKLVATIPSKTLLELVLIGTKLSCLSYFKTPGVSSSASSPSTSSIGATVHL